VNKQANRLKTNSSLKRGVQTAAVAIGQPNAVYHVMVLERGRLLVNEEKYKEAIQLYKSVLSKVPDHPDAHFLMAKLALKMKATRHAVDHMRKALKKGAGHGFMQTTMAEAYLEHGLVNEALNHAIIAAKLEPTAEAPKLMQAKAMQQFGRHQEVVQFLRNDLLAVTPNNPRALTIFAGSHKFDGSEPEIASMLQVCDAGLALDSSLFYSLGKAFNDAKDYERAIKYFKLAGDAHIDPDDKGQTPEQMIFQRELFTPTIINAKAALGHQSEQPIFIVGMPRSGTTLTEQILASHPQICGVGEQMALGRVQAQIDAVAKSEVVKAIFSLDQRALFALGENYLNTMKPFSQTAKRYADKMPHNFLRVGLINILFPNAKIIFCNRDAIDNCVSIFTSPLNENHGYAKDLKTLGEYYRAHWELMEYWKSVSQIPIFDMKYESTVANLDGQARALIAHVGLPWNDACLKFNEAKTQVATISTWQVRQPIYSTSVKRWKAYEKHIQPLIEGLGDLAVTD
jgi:tetratricopeptide (TPR) repeat protein